jgi:hypothetical protein
MPTSSTASCSTLIGRRKNCHDLYGKLGEECVVQELEEKRCISFQYCASEAMAYYGTKRDDKAICGSWAESFVFGTEMMEEDVRDHHQLARNKVNKDATLRIKCRQVTVALSKCMSEIKYPGRSG